jgi:hypothetical protein
MTLQPWGQVKWSNTIAGAKHLPMTQLNFADDSRPFDRSSDSASHLTCP